MKKFQKKVESAKVLTFKSIAYTLLVASNTVDAIKYWWVATTSTFNRCAVCGKKKLKAEVKDARGVVVNSLVYCKICEQSTLKAFKQMNTGWVGKETPQA